MRKMRNSAIDAIKGLAIIAVALYHFGGGILPYGYLGVDIFFVVGGYLLIGSLKKQIEKSEFSYWSFLFRKIIRLWPLVVISSLTAVTIGYFLMLPDDFENLAQSAIASSVFANNILQCITTKNYWDIVNLYKPLMHMWYVGVLMQAYVILPVLYLIVNKLSKDKKKSMTGCTAVVTVLSLILYLLPYFSTAWKFYYLPFRLYEITSGGLLIFWRPQANDKLRKGVAFITFILLLVLVSFRVEILSGSSMLLLTVLLSLIFIWAIEDLEFSGIVDKINRIGAVIGKRSYSIYIWHQVIVAYMFYSVFPRQSFISLSVFLLMTVILSILSYKFIEIPLGKTIGIKRKEAFVIAGTAIFTTILCLISFQIYRHAGVVRDVPELNIYQSNVHRGMHAEYCDRPYSWDKEFENDDRINILVIGNSFGRDWANILYEWDKEGVLDISYFYFTGGYTESELEVGKERIETADYVFFASGGGVDYIPTSLPMDKTYIIGNKNYGKSNGIFYAHRFSEKYFDQTAEIDTSLLITNAEYAAIFGNHYIDIMAPVMADEIHAKVFTDDNKFISQDCRHLTQSGAQYYARILDIDAILKKHE